MKPIYGHAQEASDTQGVEVARIVNRYFRQHGVRLAMSLPEEARLRMSRDINDYFKHQKYVGCRANEWWAEMIYKCKEAGADLVEKSMDRMFMRIHKCRKGLRRLGREVRNWMDKKIHR